MAEVMNTIMDWYADYKSGVCTAPGGLRVKIIRCIAGVCPERVTKSTIHRAETSSVKAVKIKDQVKSKIKGRGG